MQIGQPILRIEVYQEGYYYNCEEGEDAGKREEYTV
jgi:hypothetical protein